MAKTMDHSVAGTTNEQLERYRLLVENISDYAIFLLDETGHIASWNRGAERFKGYKPAEIIGKHFSVFYTAKDIENNKPGKELELAKADGRIEDEGWRLRKDGSRFWANVVITALYDKNGRHKGFAKVTRDLTERKMHEERLRAANLKLRTSYKELQALNAAKDEFVSLASHQLRTPATGVKQYLGLLREGFAGPLDTQQMEYLQKAYDSNDRQIEIINDLLQVAQLDAGKILLNKKPTNIVQLVTDIIDEQIDSFKARKQKLALERPDIVTELRIDPVRFRMVLENLIDNASKYTPAGGSITVLIRPSGRYLKIAVQDTGVGISEADISKLFTKFTRIPNALTHNVSGSGLGLYWVHKIVELHHGHIKVESEVGTGTTFTIFMPIGKARA